MAPVPGPDGKTLYVCNRFNNSIGVIDLAAKREVTRIAVPREPFAAAITRRYHGLLIAALPNPLGRTMMLNGLSARLRLPDRAVVYTGAEELSGTAP
ncbi:MAG: glycogen debranching enzyme N-terminal domain-containing protein, partial [Acidobacteriia bacterium]|nr:glycogen debranching enzyme N-terminal domain-containing protein [Terriglobia bacterium]